jgi:hypothetical protein
MSNLSVERISLSKLITHKDIIPEWHNLFQAYKRWNGDMRKIFKAYVVVIYKYKLL